MLETVDVTERLELAVKLQRDRLTELQVRKRIREDVQSGADQQQREYFLRKQMESIQRELGEDSASRRRGVPHQDRRGGHARRGRASRPTRSSAGSSAWASSRARRAMIRSYLDWLIAVPWSKRSEEKLDPVHAREVLDADHAGLEDVKDRITEYLAVRKLRDRARASRRTRSPARS